ncbi:MAG: hypothetical protein GY713_19210 [Actinomycetia bacterium]|nr:hypothetical protein [Actinomycetes bacterium]
MSRLLTLTSEGGPFIDARPLIGVGLVPPALGPLSDLEAETLLEGLENDETYAEVLHQWTRALYRRADDFADDLGFDRDMVRDAFAATLQNWQSALGELVGRELELGITDADVTVLAPSIH